MRKFSLQKMSVFSKAAAVLSLVSALTLLSCTTFNKSTDADDRGPAAEGTTFDARRGTPASYDPGPPKDSRWPELYGSTPNYRAIGIITKQRQVKNNENIGDDEKTGEKFRWMMGPMWYRGRLQPNQVKAFVVGQEGAQDENVTNRAFTGSTGTKLQNILNGVGIHRSYLFMNTFVYTINGQRNLDSPSYMWMEQDPSSPIVQYRHKLFDYMAETNKESLALMIGVGGGGKASLVTWIRSHGGKCSAQGDIANCDAGNLAQKFGIKNKILVIGIPHPGAASSGNGGAQAVEMLKQSLARAGKRMIDFAGKNPGWLPADTYVDGTGKSVTGVKAGSTYSWYKNAPVPFQDFAFGTNWRMGDDGTSSNRDGADKIQIFSRGGSYDANKNKAEFQYNPRSPMDVVEDKSNPIPEMGPKDLPYESQKFDSSRPEIVKAFDPGPCGDTRYSCEMSELLQGQGAKRWPNFESLGVRSHWSFGHGPIYRGRLNDATVLVVADQFGHDDIFSGRALTGHVGQRLQTFLKATGAGLNYAIVRTAPVDTYDLDRQTRLNVIINPQVTEVRNDILYSIVKNGKTKVIVTLGEFAREAIKQFPTRLPVVSLDAPLNSKGEVDSAHIGPWNAAAVEVAKASGLTSTAYSGKLTNIPRADLPAHSRWWMGTAGDRAQRPGLASDGGKASPHHYRIVAPNWITKLKPVDYREATMTFSSTMAADGVPDLDAKAEAKSVE
ncbi:MAG: hypothetical protein V4736_02305 [Bdellovibrionota bacterium]